MWLIRNCVFVMSLEPILKFIRLCGKESICKKLLPAKTSSHRRFSIRKGVLRNFAKFTGKHQCQSLFFNKLAGLRPATLLKRRLWHRCFPMNFSKFLTTPFLQNTSERLLLSKQNISQAVPQKGFVKKLLWKVT